MRSYFCLLVLCFTLTGCGSGVTVAKVSGTVTCKGVPVKDASITFSPIAKEDEKTPGKAANGNVDDNGNFYVGTFTTDDGAIVGKHRVAINFNNPYQDLPCVPGNDLILEVMPAGNSFEIELDPAFRKK